MLDFSSRLFLLLPILGSVNLKSGRYFLSFALLAVFLNWPSDLLVSYWKCVKDSWYTNHTMWNKPAAFNKTLHPLYVPGVSLCTVKLSGLTYQNTVQPTLLTCNQAATFLWNREGIDQGMRCAEGIVAGQEITGHNFKLPIKTTSTNKFKDLSVIFYWMM